MRAKGLVEGFWRLYTDDFYQIKLPVPPIPEQAAIIRFLDHADRRIRRYIRAKQKLIKLLEEQKQAIIEHAATRGLDANVAVKPTRVAWLRLVPEHWQLLPLKRWVSTKITDGPHETPEWLENGVPFISAEAMVNGLSLLALFAAWLPARRAAVIEPMVALRSE